MKNYLSIKLSEPFDFRLFEDCQEMAKYASDNNKKIDGELMAKFSSISDKVLDDYHKIVYKRDEIIKNDRFFRSRLRKRIVHDNVNCADPQDLNYLYKEFSNKIGEPEIKDLSAIQSYLAGIVSPATAATIIFTKPTVKFPLSGDITTIPFMRNLIIGSTVSLFIFVISLVLSSIPQENVPAIFTLFGKKISDLFVSLSAAALGAYFYSLHTANRYFINRTFDRKYVTYYNNRIIIGIIAGFIFSNFIDFSPIIHPMKESILANLSFIFIAILGGFSAEAVTVIFNRIVAMLVTLIKGDAKDIIESKELQYKGKAEAENIRFKLENYKKLLTFYSGNKKEITDNENLKKDFDKLFELYNK